ncbi:hypothetical protein WA556_005227, partial [Blastocystis sp. ATCC 50177/Nand II]
MNALRLLKWRRCRLLCYCLALLCLYLFWAFMRNGNTIPLNRVFSDSSISDKLPITVGGFTEETLHSPLNKLIGCNTANRVGFDREMVHSELKWVHTSQFQKQLNHYLGNMVRDYSLPECNRLVLFFPATGAFQRDVFLDPSEETDFTAIFVANYLRLHMIPLIIDSWKGPLIIVIYIPSLRQEAVVNEFLSTAQFPANAQVYIFKPREDCFDAKHLPINLMRNLAIHYVQTSHYVVLDTDLRFSQQLYESLQRVSSAVWRSRYSVVVIPVFHLSEWVVKVKKCGSFLNCTLLSYEKAPSTLSRLRSCVKSGKCQVTWKATPSDLQTAESWLAGKRSLDRLSCYPLSEVSPYVVLRRHPSVPLFDPVFYGYEGNIKMYFEELRYYSNEWYVLKDGFVVNLIHPKSTYRLRNE